jgi:hypothetical protein
VFESRRVTAPNRGASSDRGLKMEVQQFAPSQVS